MRLLAPALAALCLSAALVTPLAAQETPRFAFFSINQLVRTSKKAGAIFSELEITGKNLQEKLQAKGQELQTMQQQLNSPASTLRRRRPWPRSTGMPSTRPRRCRRTARLTTSASRRR